MGASKHTGSCHCGNVKYEVTIDLSQPVIACNCSMCQRAGTLLSFVPVDQFSLLQGDDSLEDYLFNKHVIHHKFCKKCGLKPFAEGQAPDGSPIIAVNVRCIDDVEIESLTVNQYDGRSV